MNYDSINSQRGMFFDEVRNRMYRQAMQEVISSDSVVLDLGSGLGVMGFIAAELGAKRVYMVDPAEIMDVTRQAVAASAHAQKIQCFRDTIEGVELPEQVDVIVSVMTGNFLLTEDLLPSLLIARDRWLRPGGAMIPSAATMLTAPANAPRLFDSRIDCWRSELYSGALSPIRQFSANSLQHASPQQHEAILLAPEQQLLHLDFMVDTSVNCRTESQFTVTSGGECHGLLGWFEVELGQQWLSTAPGAEKTHWRQVLLPIAKPLSLSKGDEIHAKVIHSAHRDWTWSLKTPDALVRQSTFLASPRSLANMAKHAPDYMPQLNRDGRLALQILNMLDGARSLHDLTEFLQTKDPKRFDSEHTVMDYLHELIDRFTD
ncbi:MAG: class I SAM-dependent methyltransferase [Pseudomonadota bacterium]